MKQNLSMLLASTMLLLALTSCGGGDASTATSTPAEGGDGSVADSHVTANSSGEEKTSLVFANFRDIRDPNPHLYQGEMWFQEMVYETLVSVEPEGIEPCLAESWEISEDGLTYSFKIREGVTFTNGEAFDAFVVKANFDALWDNIDRHVWMESARVVSGYEAPDATTFIITLSEPYSPFMTELGVTRPYGMAAPATMIQNSGTVFGEEIAKMGTTRDGVTEYIGTGTYYMGDYVESEYVYMERNEDYWGDLPEIERVVVKVIPDSQTRVMALESGEIDLIYGGNLIDATTLSAYTESDQYTVGYSDPTLTKHLLMNSTDEILADQMVREALTHAIDKEAINEGIFYGMEVVADNLYAPNVPYCDITLTPYEFDEAKSIELLESAGWVAGSDGIRVKDGQRLSLKYLYDVDTVTDKQIGEFLQYEFSLIGVELVLDGYERETYFDMGKVGEFDIMMNIPWGNPYDPHAALSAMRGPVYGDYAAQQGLEIKEVLDADITEVLKIVDEDERQAMYTKILTELHEAAIYIPLVYETNKALYNSDLQGVGFMTSSYVIPFWDMHY